MVKRGKWDKMLGKELSNICTAMPFKHNPLHYTETKKFHYTQLRECLNAVRMETKRFDTDININRWDGVKFSRTYWYNHECISQNIAPKPAQSTQCSWHANVSQFHNSLIFLSLAVMFTLYDRQQRNRSFGRGLFVLTRSIVRMESAVRSIHLICALPR